MTPPQNIIYIVVHDLGRHLGCYGLPVESPAIDRFARDGILFRNAVCNAPACSPSRVCAMTGQYSHVNGVIGLAHAGWALAEDRRTVVDDFNDAGWTTAHFGLSHERHPLKNRYQIDSERNWEDRYNTRRAFDNALRFLESRKEGDPGFYVNIGLSDTHPSMWSRPEPYTEHGPPDPPERAYLPPYLPDTPGERAKMGRLQAAIRYLDQEFGRFVEQLDRLDCARDTVVVFTVDHGISTGWYRDKMMCYEKGIEVALIVRMPDGRGAGRVEHCLMQNIDNAPTVLDLAGLDPPAAMDGRSYAPLLRGEPYRPHEAIFIERNFHAVGVDAQGRGINQYDPMRSVRTDDYHYIRNYRPETVDLYPLPFALPPGYEDGKKVSLSRLPRSEEELFHLRNDPAELFNVVERPEFAGLREELGARLDRWMEETDDFAGSGSPPEPQGYFGFEDWHPIDSEDSGKRRGARIPTPEAL